MSDPTAALATDATVVVQTLASGDGQKSNLRLYGGDWRGYVIRHARRLKSARHP